jgi:D-3-phosphoglycerate dehydrogenase
VTATVLISTSSFGGAGRRPLEMLEEAGVEYRLNPHGRKLQRDETVELLDGVMGLVAGTEALDRPVLEQAPRLRVISRCGSGMDNIDLEAAGELGIAVRNTPEALVTAVAELAVACILNLLRQVSHADRLLRQGVWHKPMGHLLEGKIVGIVGLGRIGRRLAQLLAPFRVKLLACDPQEQEEIAASQELRYCSLEELLQTADIVSLHLTAPSKDFVLLDRRHLALMKPSALLLNFARGGLVDESALYDALKTGRLAGACLDVYTEEPYRGPLTELPNVLLTPHIGSYAAESRLRMETEAVAHLLDALRLEPTP